MLGTLIASLLSSEATSVVTSLRRAIVVYGLVAMFALTGVGFAVGAGYIAAARTVGDLEAALWFAGGFLLVAVLIVIVYKIVAGVRHRRIARRRSVEMKTVASAAAVTLLPLLMRRGGPGIAGLIVPALGFVAYQIYRENSSRGASDDYRRD